MCQKFSVFLVISCFLAGCGGGNHEEVVDDMIIEMNNMVSLLEKIESAEDAMVAKDKLQAVAARMKAIKNKGDRMKKPSATTKKRIDEKIKAATVELGPRMNAI
ncbi:hypothetical protein OAG51_02185 [Pirellulaceae bacterium]|nr:hypothetical protein [Pirellulaceae bacterium]